MKKVLFRADGNATTGLGHLYRAFALIEVFGKTHDCTLVTNEKTTRSAIPAHYKTVSIPRGQSQEVNWLRENFPAGEHIVVLDGYQFDSDYQLQLKAAGYYVIYVDDLVSGEYHADVILNHSLSVRAADYKAPFGTRFALGSFYAILRQPFLTGQPKISNYGSAKALVAFGGADPLHFTEKVCEALLRQSKVLEIHVIAGAAFSRELVDRVRTLDHRIVIHNNLSDRQVAELMADCDFAVCSASNVLYEVCAIGLPVLAGYYVKNQEGLYQGFVKKEAIFGCGDISSFSVADFSEKLDIFFRDRDWETYRVAQKKLFDGRICERLRGLVVPVRYRRAVSEDMRQVFTWSNDPLTRANSYVNRPIELEEHRQWFEKKLLDENTLMLVAEIDAVPAGFIRYEKKQDHAVVGVLVGQEFRGRSLAQVFLRDTAVMFHLNSSLPVFAYIKIENVASIKSFVAAGYEKLKEEVVNNIPSVVYKLEARC